MGERVICDSCNDTKIMLTRMVLCNDMGWVNHKWICFECIKSGKYEDVEMDYDQDHETCSICQPVSLIHSDDRPRQK